MRPCGFMPPGRFCVLMGLLRVMLARCSGPVGMKKRPDGIKPYERNGIYFAVLLHGIVHTSDRIAPLLGTGFF